MLEPASGKRIADRYVLANKLGEGGMGSVWSAEDEKLKRDVAVKLVTERIAESERALARFEREAQSVARLRSPYITQVYDYGVENGSPYIIMELLSGEDLKALLAREVRLSLQDTGRIVVQIAKALHAAHSSGIIHRDLKPANVFIADEHGEQVCKVFDFGVAKALNDLANDGETTAEGVLLGTPRYMSPEQAHGAKRVDHRSDLWSLGVIAYICVTGKLPFIAAGTGHVLVKICTEDPPKPSALVDGLPGAVDAFFAKALAKEADDRIQTAKELGTAFAELAEVSMSTFSLTSSPGQPRPSWSGFDSSSPSISIRGSTSQDGTLGASTHSPMAAPPKRGRRLVLGAGLAAALGIGALVGVTFMQNESVPSGAGADQATNGPATTGPVTTSDNLGELKAAPAASPDTSASAASTAVPASSTELDNDKKAPASARPRAVAAKRRGTKAVEPKPETTAAPPPAAPPPKAKSKDGMELFNGRF